MSTRAVSLFRGSFGLCLFSFIIIGASFGSLGGPCGKTTTPAASSTTRHSRKPSTPESSTASTEAAIRTSGLQDLRPHRPRQSNGKTQTARDPPKRQGPCVPDPILPQRCVPKVSIGLISIGLLMKPTRLLDQAAQASLIHSLLFPSYDPLAHGAERV